MIAKLVIDRKREGQALGPAEIRDFINGFTSGQIPDYQMSALAMTVCCRGMTARETADLTEAMMHSGRCLSWSMPTADKHSTGGVGDKLSLIIQPVAAACGVAVPSLAGRGLGLTGGTADKMETIPGYSCSQTLERFQEITASAGVSLSVQTDEICPADKKLYALRDVTGTVASIPLITASILSKKLAEGAHTLVFDVKCGCGAFMKTFDDAKALADSLVSGSRAAGRNACALVTRMDAPLGFAVGNVNEVAEALAILGMKECSEVDVSRLSDVADLSLEFAARMVSLEKGIALDDARAMCRERLADGSALGRFEAMVAAHGGDLKQFCTELKRPRFKFRIQAMRSGWIAAIDAEKVARIALALGAGRAKAGDRIDPLAGVTLAVKCGDKVSVGSPLATLETTREPESLERLAADLLKAFCIVSERHEPKDLILAEVC